jgi:hypothetical protein
MQHNSSLYLIPCAFQHNIAAPFSQGYVALWDAAARSLV